MIEYWLLDLLSETEKILFCLCAILKSWQNKIHLKIVAKDVSEVF